MIKPTVGRKVWYWASREQFQQAQAVNFDHDQGPQPQDATIVHVWGDRCVNLLTVTQAGLPLPATSVVLMQEGDPVPEHSFATWMPFQVGQAKAQKS